MHPAIAARVAVKARKVTHNRKVRAAVAVVAVMPLVIVGCMTVPFVIDTVPPPATTTTMPPISDGPDSIPRVAWTAIVRASIGSEVQGGCRVSTHMLGGVMWAESGFGTHNGAVADEHGDVRPPIFGPELAPGSGFAVIVNDDYGRSLGVTTTYSKAVGPTQFLPTTWRVYGRDGNGDGRQDPQNLFDGAAATVAYLCGHGWQEDDPAAVRRAILAYNPSDEYVTTVLGYAARLQAITAVPAAVVAVFDGNLATVGGITVAAGLAPRLQALLDAARADGIVFGGYGWRSTATQVELRRAHCGDSHYALYDMPSGDCTPPTARPGSSWHERGLAVDFYADGATLTRGSRGFRWLQQHAGEHGLYNLPSEPWHWSTTGG